MGYTEARTTGSMTTRQGQNAFAVLILALTAAILLSLYLSLRHAQLVTKQAKAGTGLCSFSAELDCDSVLLTPQALTFGIPNSVFALLLYSNLLLCGLITWYLQGNLWRWYVRIGLIVDIAAVLVSVYFAYVLLTRMPSKCVFCTALQACSLIALGAYLGLLRSTSEVIPNPREWPLAGLVVLSCFLLTPLLFLSVELFYMQGRESLLRRESEENAAILKDPKYNLFLYVNSPKVNIPVDEETPIRGDPEAKHTLVVFADFQCRPCSKFHRTCTDAVRNLPGMLKVYFKHFPLARPCNPAALDPSFHPFACRAAYAAEAARRQGRFWDYADLLFEHRTQLGQEIFVKLAEQLQLDLDQFRQDMASQDVQRRVAEDIELGNSLRLTGTPGVFLDGRILAGNEVSTMFWALIRVVDVAPAQLLAATQPALPFVPSPATGQIDSPSALAAPLGGGAGANGGTRDKE